MVVVELPSVGHVRLPWLTILMAHSWPFLAVCTSLWLHHLLPLPHPKPEMRIHRRPHFEDAIDDFLPKMMGSFMLKTWFFEILNNDGTRPHPGLLRAP